MRTRKLTSTDVCEVSGYNRFQLRGLLDKIPLFADLSKGSRVAREFSPQDMIVLRVLFVLEHHIGINRATATSIAGPLSKVLSGPKKINKNAQLVISFEPLSVAYLDSNQPLNRDSLVIALGAVFERVDHYLIPSQSYLQTGLTLGPMLVSNKSTQSAT